MNTPTFESRVVARMGELMLEICRLEALLEQERAKNKPVPQDVPGKDDQYASL
jgi:hypothetical protein